MSLPRHVGLFLPSNHRYSFPKNHQKKDKIRQKVSLDFSKWLPYNGGTKWLKVVENGGFIHLFGGLSMTGEYQHSLDNKGRIFIPAKLRDELGEVFFITLSMDRCLCAYSKENWQSLSEKVSAMPYVKQRKMRPLFAHAARCELDAQGRALIPQALRDYAGLVKNVTVVGCNNHAELWDSEAWKSIYEMETTPENIAAVMEELEF